MPALSIKVRIPPIILNIKANYIFNPQIECIIEKISGLLSLAGGVILSIYPGISVVILPFVVGFTLLFLSFQLLGYSFEMKSLGILNWRVNAVMTNHQTTTLIKQTPPDIFIEISKKSCKVFDFFKAEELVEMGRYAARERLN